MLEIGLEGRPLLLNAHEPDGSEGPRPFVTSTAWAWGTIGFEVDPRPRAG